VLSLAKRSSDIFESSEPSEKRQFVKFLLQNPTIDNKKLEYSLRKLFDTLLEMSGQPIRLRELNKFRTVNWKEIERQLSFCGLNYELAPNL
jgi:hypothetical protein